MRLKIFLHSIVPAIAVIFLISCSGKTAKSEYVGKTFADPTELGLFQGMGVLLYGPGIIGKTDKTLSLNVMSTDMSAFTIENLHIFICEHNEDNSQKTILAEMDIDRNTTDAYGHEPVAFMDDGKYVIRDYLLRYDPSDFTIRELYFIDVEKLRFVPKKPLPDMRIEYGY